MSYVIPSADVILSEARDLLFLIRRNLSILFGLALLSGPALAQDTTSRRPASPGILVDFQDADLRTVITSLAEAGNINVFYGDLPSRRVTLRLRQPVARADLLPLLRSLAQSNGLQVVEEGGLVKLLVDDSRSPAATAQAQQAAAKQAAETRLFVYRLKHVRAAKIGATLQQIFGGVMPGTIPTGLSNRSLSQQLSANQLPPTIPDSVRTAVVVAGAAANLPGMLHGDVQIVPDETTNAIVIHAQPADYEIVRQAIEALDLRPLQVLIEVLIVEVRRSSELDLSVSAQSSRRDGSSTGPVVASNSTADLILRLSKDVTFDINIAVRALQTRGDVRVLSRPVLLAQNNQEAKILVGSQRPFVQVFRSLPTDAAVRDQVVQYKDVGTSLTILPTINPDGYVNLQVSQEVSTATQEVQFGAPVISSREASTHLFVRDGRTAVLGGLIDRQVDHTRSGLPVLSSLPVVGALFGSRTDREANSELFLFLTPHLIETDADADRLREQIEQRSPAVKEQAGKIPPLPTKPPQ
jgi:general secretion pathway protein D